MNGKNFRGDYFAYVTSRKKILERIKEFKKFANITDEQYSEVVEAVNNYYKQTLEGRSYKERFTLVYNYVNRKYSRMDYDLKILFIILALDPELEALSIRLSFKLISNAAIDSIADKKKAAKLSEERDKRQKEYESALREKFEMYEPLLPFFEKFYQDRYVFTKSFAENVDYNYSNILLESLKTEFNTCDFISNDDISRVLNSVELYKSLFTDINYYNLIFHVYKQNELLNLNNSLEMILFLVKVLDPELKLLELYNKSNNFKEDFIDLFGFYNDLLLYIEQEYVNQNVKVERKRS